MNLKYLILTTIVIFSSNFAQAQLKIGAKGGGNFSYIKEKSDINSIDWKALTSYYVGGFVEYELNDRLSARGEALYSFEGAEFENANVIQKVELNYLNLPLLLRLKLIHGIFLDAGIEPGVIISKEDANLGFNKNTEIGLILGGGFQVGERWAFNFRYVQGLSNVYEFSQTGANGQPIDDATGKTRLWQIGAEFFIFK